MNPVEKFHRRWIEDEAAAARPPQVRVTRVLPRFRPLRALRWLADPYQGLALPVKYRRLCWAGVALRLLVLLPLFLALIGPYAIALGFTKACDWAGGRAGNLLIRCYNADLERSGWRQPLAPAPQLSPEWRSRVPTEDH